MRPARPRSLRVEVLEDRITPSFSINDTGTEGDADLMDGVADTGLFAPDGKYLGLSGKTTVGAALEQAHYNIEHNGAGPGTFTFVSPGSYPSIGAPVGWSVEGIGGANADVFVTGGTISGFAFTEPCTVGASGDGAVIQDVTGASSASLGGKNGTMLNVTAESLGASGEGLTISNCTATRGGDHAGRHQLRRGQLHRDC